MSKIKCAWLRRGSGSGAASADLVLVRSCFRRFASLFFRHAPARVIFRATNRLRSSARSGLRVGPAVRVFCAIPPSFSWQSGRHPQGLRPPECGRQWPGQEDGMPAARGVAFSAVGPLDLPPSCGLAHVRMGTEVRPHPSRTRASACSPRSSAGACQRTPRVRGGPAGARRPRGGHWGRGRGSLGSES